MITISIVGLLAYAGYGIYQYKKYGTLVGVFESHVTSYIVLGTALLMMLSFLGSTFIGTNIKDYSLVENYSYVTEDGAIETIEGDFYVKDGEYYIKNDDKSKWIPFYPNEYVEAKLPKNHLPALIDKE